MTEARITMGNQGDEVPDGFYPTWTVPLDIRGEGGADVLGITAGVTLPKRFRKHMWKVVAVQPGHRPDVPGRLLIEPIPRKEKKKGK